MIKNRADAFGCLAIAFIGAFFLAWILIGLSSLGTLPDERLRPPIWQSAAVRMTISFGAALALVTFFAGRSHRIPVFVVGLLIAVTLYVVVGIFWWFRM